MVKEKKKKETGAGATASKLPERIFYACLKIVNNEKRARSKRWGGERGGVRKQIT